MIHRSCDYVSVKLLTYLNSKGLNRSVPKILGVDHGSVNGDGHGVDHVVDGVALEVWVLTPVHNKKICQTFELCRVGCVEDLLEGHPDHGHVG